MLNTSQAVRVALDRAGHRIAAVGADGRAVTWDVRTGRASAILAPEKPTQQSIADLALSPDGATLAVSDPDNTVRVWNTAKGTAIGTLREIRGDHVIFSGDGTLLATENPTQLWDAATLEPLGGSLGGSVPNFAITPDGNGLVVVDTHDIQSGAIRVYDINPTRLVGDACRIAGRTFTAAERKQYGIIGATACGERSGPHDV